MSIRTTWISLTLWMATACCLLADVQVTVDVSQSTSHFQLESIPVPAINDAGAEGRWRILQGKADANSGPLEVLFDGGIPTNDDQPDQNFFFTPGTNGGWIAVDLEQAKDLTEIVTYSWHNGSRGPQVYAIYGATGEEQEFAFPKATETKAALRGWTKIADVDTRTKGQEGGQHAARISDSRHSLGRFRHLLFAIEASELTDAFGNTFFSEIDIVSGDPKALNRIAVPELRALEFSTDDSAYRFTVDMTQAPDLEKWTESELKPVIQEWYPKIVAALPSESFQAAKHVRFQYQPDSKMRGIPAYASGATISMNADWFRRELEREARGAVVHEMVHVVQVYPGRGRRNRGVVPAPGWLVEGIPDYIRWFLYEPQTKGALLSKRALKDAKHDASYRTSANFIDWVVREYDKDGDLLERLNAACRQGKYSSEIWQQLTGKTEEELATAWRSQ